MLIFLILFVNNLLTEKDDTKSVKKQLSESERNSIITVAQYNYR